MANTKNRFLGLTSKKEVSKAEETLSIYTKKTDKRFETLENRIAMLGKSLDDTVVQSSVQASKAVHDVLYQKVGKEFQRFKKDLRLEEVGARAELLSEVVARIDEFVKDTLRDTVSRSMEEVKEEIYGELDRKINEFMRSQERGVVQLKTLLENLPAPKVVNHFPEQPTPVVNVTVPEQIPIMNVTSAEQPAPIVNVTTPEQPNFGS